eukprot:5469972-Amphidinium_carterae.1
MQHEQTPPRAMPCLTLAKHDLPFPPYAVSYTLCMPPKKASPWLQGPVESPPHARPGTLQRLHLYEALRLANRLSKAALLLGSPPPFRANPETMNRHSCIN